MLPLLLTLIFTLATSSISAVTLPVLTTNQTQLSLIAGQTTRYVALGRGVQVGLPSSAESSLEQVIKLPSS